MLSRKAVITSFIVFDLTRTGHEPKLYHIREEQANHYTADEVIPCH
jgi:hypothetical protein